MSAKKDCKACSNLQDNAPEFVTNGVTDNVYNSLVNDTGLNSSSGHNDCDDLNDVNDCLIGNMEDEISSYDTCGWQDYMRDFVHNLWTTLKAIIAAICGLWIKVNKHDCEIDYLFKGDSFHIGEEPSDGSYIVAGKGVSFLTRGEGTYESDISLFYIAGGLCRGTGSLVFHTNNWTESDNTKCYNYDTDAVDPVNTYNRLGNDQWAISNNNTVDGNELVYEIRLKLDQFPTVKKVFGGQGQEQNMGGFHLNISTFDAGEYAYGQHGHCKADGTAYSGMSPGHIVRDGYEYIQVRMSYIDKLAPSSGSAADTVRYWCGIRFKRDNIPC